MKKAVIQTNKGTIEFELFTELAPITTRNFIGLAERGFYDGLIWHRVVDGFVVQGGDPNGNGTGGSGVNIPLEVCPELKHDSEGVVAMARSMLPDSASSQFYITLGAFPHLDMQYAVFGKVFKGMEVVRQLVQGDFMLKVTIEDDEVQEKA
ncbi:MAG: peptidylprolyl isomerase [Abditibacteriota bacterium]|nr:peptidylprolyl isomerase [Abditibacteriota bacterium]